MEEDLVTKQQEEGQDENTTQVESSDNTSEKNNEDTLDMVMTPEKQFAKEQQEGEEDTGTDEPKVKKTKAKKKKEKKKNTNDQVTDVGEEQKNMPDEQDKAMPEISWSTFPEEKKEDLKEQMMKQMKELFAEAFAKERGEVDMLRDKLGQCEERMEKFTLKGRVMSELQK